MSRKVARGQQLPPHEVEYLNNLQEYEFKQRAHDLYQAGWSLDSIGSALHPPRPRTTIHHWVQQFSDSQLRVVLDAPIPNPELNLKAKPRRSPGISEDEKARITYLVPLAKTYRAKMAQFSAPAVANRRLTELCIELHQRDVSIRELAEAAGVTYRAMYKRIKL